MTSLPSSVDVRVDVGEGAKVISASNDYTNGGTLTGGFFNKYSDVVITHSFTDSSLNGLFRVVTEGLEDGKYELVTTGDWNTVSAQSFFARSGLDGSRTVTITATDSGGLSATASTRIDEDDIVVVSGKIQEYANPNTGEGFNAYTISNAELALENDFLDVWATAGSSGTDPGHDDYYDLGAIEVFVNNKVFTNSALTTPLQSGEYVFTIYYNRAQHSASQKVQIVEIGSNGTVTSIKDTYIINQ